MNQGSLHLAGDQGEVSGTKCVHVEAFLYLSFTCFDMVHRGRIHDAIGAQLSNTSGNRIQIRDLYIFMAQCADFAAVICKCADHVAAKLTVPTDHNDFHRVPATAIA